MKTDFYTKTILTVIAISLVLIAFQNSVIIPTAQANSEKFVTLPLNNDGSLNVVVKKMPDELDVNIKEVDSWAFQYVRPIKVEIDN